jgi:butyrate kinase
MQGILAINPGATSTKFAVFEGERPLCKRVVEHSIKELDQLSFYFQGSADQ